MLSKFDVLSLPKYLLFTAVLVLIASCNGDEDPMIIVDPPASYSFERDGMSTVSFTGQSDRIGMATELTNAMKDFSISSDALLEMFSNQTAAGQDANPYSDPSLNASSKSVKSKVAASKDFFSANTAESATIREDFEKWIVAQVTEVFPNENELAAPGKSGQIADGSSVRYVNGDGLEYNQIVTKGLIGALMLDQIVNNYLSPAILDESDNRTLNDAGTPADGKIYTTMEHKWDEAYGYLFGASANSADALNDLGSADAFLNKYLARVNGDPDFAGIAQDVYDAFKLGRAAIVAGDYNLRNAQAELLRGLLSKVIGIRAVYYLQQGKNALPANGNNFGGAFHDFSEGVGFIYSLRFTRKPNTQESYFSRSEVDGFIDRLMAGNGFWEVTAETLDEISESIADKFDFTVDQASE